MEPITFTAIVAFLVYTSASGVVNEATADAYRYLKDTLKSKYGDQSGVVDAVSLLEDKPESNARKSLVREEVEEAEADREPEIESAAKALLALLEDQPGGERYTQTATGRNIAQAQDHSTASVDVRPPGEHETE